MNTFLKSSSLLLLTSLLFSCSNNTVIPEQAYMSSNSLPGISQDIQTTKLLNMERKDSPEIKKSNLKIKDKKNMGEIKIVQDLKIRIDLSHRNYIEDDIESIAKDALKRIDTVETFREAYIIGIGTLDNMAKNGILIAKISYISADSTLSWRNGYKIVASSLDMLANGMPNTSTSACDMVVDFMAKVDNYEEGYRIGYANLQYLKQINNSEVRNMIDKMISSAESTTNWPDGYDVLRKSFSELKAYFKEH